jgi:hypothetical protein
MSATRSAVQACSRSFRELVPSGQAGVVERALRRHLARSVRLALTIHLAPQ